MMSIGEDDLICDFAETYGIYDMRSLPAPTVAVLADGLSPDSRIKSRITGKKDDVPFDTLLNARIADLLATLVWFQTKDGSKGINRPASILEPLLHREKQETEYKTFDSPDDFMEAWRAGGGA